MKEWAHLIAAFVLAITSLSIFAVTQINNSVKPLDTARFYTMKWEKGNVNDALKSLKDVSASKPWMSERCQAMVNLTTDVDCLTQRTNIRDNILTAMKCTEYGSQTCSYLRLMLKALLYTSTTERVDKANPASPFKIFGSNLKGVAGASGKTYQTILQNIVTEAPEMFHGAFRAEESDKTLILRSALYNLIMMAILGNIVVHKIDSYEIMSSARFMGRALSFVLVFITSFVFLVTNTGNAMVLSLILITSFVALVYFEMFLDPTIVRPWIHPFVFCTIYMSCTVLALIENGVREYNVIVIHMLMSMCAGQAFMSMAWYFVGLSEKLRIKGSASVLYQVYLTKETQLALLGSILVQLLIPLHQTVAPYSYTYNSTFLLLSPLIFAALSVLSITVIQGMPLDDCYGKDELRKQRANPRANEEPFSDPTAITAAKLYSSLLLLLFGTVITMIFLSEHIATFRAYLDTMPETSIQYDITGFGRKFLMGQGLNLLSVI